MDDEKAANTVQGHLIDGKLYSGDKFLATRKLKR